MSDDRERLDLSGLDEIKASSYLKQKTLDLCINKGKRKFLNFKMIASFAVSLVMVFSFFYFGSIKNKEAKITENDLKRISSKNELISMIEKNLKQGPVMLEKAERKGAQDVNSHSNTNVQVEGIDEADIVKTDGKYIYSINNVSNKLLIINADNSANIVKSINAKDLLEKEAKEYKDFSREIYLREMFLYKNDDNKYLVLLSNVNRYKNFQSSQEEKNKDAEGNYKIRPFFFNLQSTLVSIIDIKNIDDIKVLKQFEVSGYLLSSRINKDKFYMVTNKYLHYFYNTGQEEDIIPFYIIYDNECIKKEIELQNIMYNENNISSNFTVITSFDLKDFNADLISILGNFDNLYMSKGSLYLTSIKGEEIKEESQNNSKDTAVSYYLNKTYIYKFKLGDKVDYVNFAQVEGTLINQFSMDEYNNYFRVAVTKEKFSQNASNTTNNLYVFDKNLKLVGSIENIAEGERIYSTRFVKDKLYMVTFKQVDPLFVIDLKNPYNPKILGLLKIPGYSTYLHPLSDKKIIGFGMDTADDNGRVINSGMKIALFDISELENPKEIAKIKIGGKGTFSESLYNHKALTVYNDYYAFDICETKDDDSYIPIFNGLILLEIKDNGINIKAKISNDSDQKDLNYDYGYRAVFINDNMYVVSNYAISIVNLKDMSINKVKIEYN